jgi:CheY-like chemotaxis protein
VRICWADDQTDSAGTFASAIADLDAEIVFVTDGTAALEKIREEPFDLLVVDLHMPPGTWGGLWLLERIHVVGDAPPALVLSGEGSQQETIQALRLGAVDYVEKRKVATELRTQVVAILERSLAQVIDGPETQTVEFKRSLRYDGATGGANKALAQPALKTIAAFANTEGGTLIIGRTDEGEVVGIDADLSVMQSPDIDAFELHLRDLVASAMGPTTNHLVDVSCPHVRGKRIARVRVAPSSRPIFMKDKGTTAFFVRTGNLTRQLDVAEAHTYIRDRWPS